MGVRQPFAIFVALRDEKKEALPYPSPLGEGQGGQAVGGQAVDLKAEALPAQPP